MPLIVGPNGAIAEVEDELTAASLVGDGERGYSYHEPEAPAPRRAPRRKASETPE
jgi:hypothetical protein